MPVLADRLTFALERLIQRGAPYQLLVIAGLIVLVALGGGLLAWGLTDAFAHPGAAVWWAFLRLTDPGYLGDDEGTALRVISTVVTVLGYVLFMGSLIAILTQSLSQTMRRLESGLTPIAVRDHVLILGWTNRTAPIVRELMLSEGRVRRFLSRRGARRLRIVILAEQVDARLRQELRDQIGPALKHRQVIFRSGSSMRIEHLQRVAFGQAAAILLPGADFELGGAQVTDTRIIKTLMSMARYSSYREAGRVPIVVAEIFDTQKIPIARRAYEGALQIIAGDAFISRLIAQNARHPGLSYVYAELLSYAHGNEVYVRRHPELAGQPFGALLYAFPEAVLLGVVRPEGRGFRPLLNPPATFTPEPEDRFVLVARRYEAAVPSTPAAAAGAAPALPAGRMTMTVQPQRRVLMLGWSHKVRVLIQEFASYPAESFEIDVLSVVPAAERAAAMRRLEVPGERVRVRHLEGDYTVRADLERAGPAGYDNVILLGSDWLASGEEADARTILGYVLLRALLPEGDAGPAVLVELIDPANARLFRRRPGEVIISPVILSHMLAHAALRQELTAVFGELFGPGGAEIFFRAVGDYGLTGQPVTFRDVQRQAAAAGEIALGVRLQREADGPGGGVYLNPSRTQTWTFRPEDRIVVLTRYAEAASPTPHRPRP
ncbi:MAG: ion channel DMI1 [Bacteroidetes bacterium]|nr:MAG: ion channel DMI1 [Bacteroidota bacterium]